MGTKLLDLVDGLKKEAMEAGQGPAVLPQPPVAPAPIPEEGVANPAQKAQERADDKPANEAMGDDPASMRAKIKADIMSQAGAALAAGTRGEEEETVSMVLHPKSPEVMSPPAAPAGGGPGQIPIKGMGDIAMSAAKMSSDMATEAERLYEHHRKIAMEAQEAGDNEKYAEHAGQANAYGAIVRRHTQEDEVSKQAAITSTLQGVLDRFSVDRTKVAADPAAPEAPAETPPAGTEKTAEELEIEQHIESLGREYLNAGKLAGEGFNEVTDLDSKTAALDERIEKLGALDVSLKEGIEKLEGLLAASA